MPTTHVLVNPHAGKGDHEADTAALQVLLDEPLIFCNIAGICDYGAFFAGIPPEDKLIIAGGDGTLNRFVNDTASLPLPENICLFPIGSGNDFARDLGYSYGSSPFPVGRFLRPLPEAETPEGKKLFLNGIGFGIDGYCCEAGEKLRARGKRDIRYTAIAVKGLLFRYKPCGATVTVDGTARRYEKVWLIPIMQGRYYGGGMMPAPMQERCGSGGKLTVMVLHGAGRLKVLSMFPSLFRGEHIRFRKHVEILQGDVVRVEYDRPVPLQIDGEVIPRTRCCTAKSRSALAAEKEFSE